MPWYGCRFVKFRPVEGFCTCNDRELNGLCCHLLAASQHPTFAQVRLPPLTCPAADDVISISGAVRYETPAREPLGDNPAVELQRMRAAREEATASLQQRGSSADPSAAEALSLTNGIKRCVLGLPDGEAREQCMGIIREAAERVKATAEAAGFQPTAVRAAKKETKFRSRSENRRKERPLYPGRASKRARLTTDDTTPAAFPALKKKGVKSDKVSRGKLAQTGSQATSLVQATRYSVLPDHL